MSLLPSSLLLQLKPKTMALCVFGLVLGFSTVTLGFLYLEARGHQATALREQVRQLAALSASMVDPDLHEQLVGPGQLDSETYALALKPLVKLHLLHPEVQYVYTMRCGAEGKEWFVLDTTQDPSIRMMLDARGVQVEPSGVMQPYEVPDDKRVDEGRVARSRGQAYVYAEPYHDNYGTFISAEAPLFDRQGREIGYAGVDYSMKGFETSMADLRNTGFISLGFAVLLSLLLSRLAYEMRVRALIQFEQVRSAEQQARIQKERAEAAMADKAQLLAVTSHDLKNPLGAIVGLADMSLKELRGGSHLAPEDLQDRLLLISQASAQMQSLIREILAHEGLEQRGLELHAEPLDVAALIQRVIVLNQPSAERKRIRIESRLEGGLRATLDPTRIHEAFDNLLSNAIKYGPQGSRIEVALDSVEGGRSLRFSVRDEGPGIAAEHRDKLFQRFQTLGAAPTGGELATGLGLSIVKSIVEMHGGRVGCDSGSSQGSLFWILLPREGVGRA
ncbi:MAG TPA: HAMP domain-containing sensor histidine kinase [Luteolibacter sp.]|nr:HAMP domain-containing sensor histidine kinase [Luteolibacter sp.]